MTWIATECAVDTAEEEVVVCFEVHRAGHGDKQADARFVMGLRHVRVRVQAIAEHIAQLLNAPSDEELRVPYTIELFWPAQVSVACEAIGFPGAERFFYRPAQELPQVGDEVLMWLPEERPKRSPVRPRVVRGPVTACISTAAGQTFVSVKHLPLLTKAQQKKKEERAGGGGDAFAMKAASYQGRIEWATITKANRHVESEARCAA